MDFPAQRSNPTTIIKETKQNKRKTKCPSLSQQKPIPGPNSVLVGFFIGVIKNQPKETWGWKSLFHITDHNPWLWEVKAGTQAWQEFWDRNWSRGHGRILLTRLFLTTCSTYFLKAWKTTIPNVTLPVMIWAIPHELSIKKGPTCLPTGPSGRDIFSISSQMIPVCVKLT